MSNMCLHPNSQLIPTWKRETPRNGPIAPPTAAVILAKSKSRYSSVSRSNRDAKAMYSPRASSPSSSEKQAKSRLLQEMQYQRVRGLTEVVHRRGLEVILPGLAGSCTDTGFAFLAQQSLCLFIFIRVNPGLVGYSVHLPNVICVTVRQ